MNKELETAIRNMFFIVLIEMIATPLGLWLYVFLGRWHITHVILGMGYLAAIIKLFDTANILVRHIRIEKYEKKQVHNDEGRCP